MRKRNTLLVVIELAVTLSLCAPWVFPDALANAAGKWRATGSMGVSRRNAVMERLPDGRYLVAGGTDTTGVDGTASVFYDTAEIYDPVAGTWTGTGNMIAGRALATSQILADGKILIVGGLNGSGPLASAEIYNPATGTFSPTDSLSTARADHADARLSDGRILVVGGFDTGGVPIASAEIYTYNPGTGTGAFSATDSMDEARHGHTASVVGAGKVLVAGGFGVGGAALSSAELFDPAGNLGAGLFSPANSLNQARGNHRATMLPTGEVFVTGGNGGGGVLATTELYDPDTDTFTGGPSMSQARQSHGSHLLPNGLVLVGRGNKNSSTDWDVQTNFLASNQVYDRVTNSFTATSSKITASSNGTTRVLWTGKLLVAGGGTAAAELYTPNMSGMPEDWQSTGTLVTARSGHQQNLLDDGRVLLTGGTDTAGNPLASAELYDYTTGTFTATAGPMASPRRQHRNFVLSSGKVLVTGGSTTSTGSGTTNTTELFDPVAGTFTAGPNMQAARRLHRPTMLANGKTLITGGIATGGTVLQTAELYDPATGAFTFTTGNMVVARRSHQEVRLTNGKVLIVGGIGTTGLALNSAELYDPTTDTFTATSGNMSIARNNPNVTRLPSGKVLVVSGNDGSNPATPLNSAEIYDPATGLFSPTASMSTARDGNRSPLLDNGLVLYAGGQTTSATTDVTATAELYNFLTGTFSLTGSFATARQDYSSTNLPNGRILAAGGVDAAGNALNSAELYIPPISGTLFITADKASPQPSGTGITFTATASGGAFPIEFQWWVFNGSVWSVGKDWSTSNSFAWTPGFGGDYVIWVWARDRVASPNGSGWYSRSVNFTITGPAGLKLTDLIADKTAPQPIGTTVTFTATAAGGTAPVQFKWWVFNGSAWSVGKDWSTSNSFAWNLPGDGNYKIRVWARSNGNTTDAPENSAWRTMNWVTYSPRG